jgi:ring-1,2-phenylacetyl-CoA epoxidase subunit PaaC
VNEQERQLLLAIADDELVLGWRDSEWTGIAPVLEEDVALSSIAQNEIGHARAIYQLLTEDADALAFDRSPEEYRCAQLVELRFVPDWARTIARRVLYEAADEIRLAGLKASPDEAVSGLAAKIDREEAYHRMHAQMWRERLAGEPRFEEALDELWPYAIAMSTEADWGKLSPRLQRETPSNSLLQGLERGAHTRDWPRLWEEMTEVRRSLPGATW